MVIPQDHYHDVQEDSHPYLVFPPCRVEVDMAQWLKHTSQ